jgi:hypothetical protein
MKLSFCIDVWPGMKPELAIPFQWPPRHAKSEGSTRYRIDVEIPDPQPDHVIEVKPTEVKP